MFIKFVNGKSYWSDQDHSESDKIKYYEVDPKLELKTGHPFELIDNKPVPFDEEKLAIHEKKIQEKILLDRKKFDLLKEKDINTKTITARAHYWLGFDEKDTYYSDTEDYLLLLSHCHTLLLLPKGENQTLAAKWVLTLPQLRNLQYKNGIEILDNMTIEELENVNFKDGTWFKDLPFIEI